VLQDLIRTQPDSADANYLLGDALLAQDHPEQAIPYLEKAVRLVPGQLHAHGALGRAYALAGRPAEAIPHLEQAVPTDDDGSLRLQLARAYQAAGQADKAQVALAAYEEFRKAAVESAPTDAAITPPEGVVR
jgi:predicted Zn-dependent protease